MVIDLVQLLDISQQARNVDWHDQGAGTIGFELEGNLHLGVTEEVSVGLELFDFLNEFVVEVDIVRDLVGGLFSHAGCQSGLESFLTFSLF